MVMTSYSANDKLLRYVNVKGQFLCTFFLVFSSLLLLACSPQATTMPTTMEKSLRFLALGDSYTIGESVDSTQSWPSQLTEALGTQGVNIEAPLIIARTGWTTRDLLAAIAEVAPQGDFDLVTLLIGVNNQYQGRDIEAYRQEFRTLLGLAIEFTGGEPAKVLVLSIPDWGVTPFAQGRNRALISDQIDQFNVVNLEESQAASIHYFDITPISRQSAQDASLLAPDNLHPSGKMYAAWVDLILPQVIDTLK
jgi:lysophospholipase L1-like esterase